MTKEKNNFLLYLRITLPAIAAVLLFFCAVFYFFLPRYENSLLKEKKNQIRELVHATWYMIDLLNTQVETGLYTMEDAKNIAADHLRSMRYGNDGKDYFWISDFTPTLIMHPYRPDLEARDLSDFTDPHGTRLFMEFIKKVKNEQEGYVPYMWQWKDDPARIVPKLSYVKEFKPWGWIIGTGIYLEDVNKEITSLSGDLIRASLLILLVVSLIALHQILQATKLLRLRQQAEDELVSYKEQLEIKVRDRTEELEESNSMLSSEIDEKKKIAREKELLIQQLQESLDNIKTLKGLLPICSYCKKIRDDTGYWEAIDSYISLNSEAEFSHGICPDCLKKEFPDICDSILEQDP